MRRFLGGVSNVLGVLLIVGVFAVCLPLTVPRVMGYEIYAIVSGSMEPTIPTGSLVYAKEAEPEEIAEGEVIVYQGILDSTPVTHRVKENQREAEQFITKGDANEGEDVSPVPYTHLLGRVALHVPALGYVLPAASTMEGKLSLLGVLAAAVLLRLLGARLRRKTA